jgi:hypothetical protein
MTSIFSETWMCRLCGRELCGECFTQLRAAGPPGGAAATARREALARVRVGFVACSKGREHGPGDFCPLTRFAPAELAGAVREMERLVAQEDEQVADVPETLGTLMPAEPPALPLYPASALPEAPAAVPATAVPSHPTRLFADGELSEDAFRALWARGDPLVIGGLLSKLALPWSPAWFVAKYGTQACKIVDCQTEKSKDTHVADFFATFGHYTPDRRQWKLKVERADIVARFGELMAPRRIGHLRQTSRASSQNCSRISATPRRSRVTFAATARSTWHRISRRTSLGPTWVRCPLCNSRAAMLTPTHRSEDVQRAGDHGQ